MTHCTLTLYVNLYMSVHVYKVCEIVYKFGENSLNYQRYINYRWKIFEAKQHITVFYTFETGRVEFTGLKLSALAFKNGFKNISSRMTNGMYSLACKN